MRRAFGGAIALCLAACGGSDGGDFIVPGYQALAAEPAAASCSERDYEDDGRIDEYNRFVDSGDTWTLEQRDGDRALVGSSIFHFDAAGRLLEERDDFPDGTHGDCRYVYDSFGRQLSEACDWDGDGVDEVTARVTAWTDDGLVRESIRDDAGRTSTSRRTYDVYGRLLGDDDRWDDDGSVRATLDVVYDDARRTRWSRSETAYGVREQTVTFDGRGRLLRVEATARSASAPGYVEDFYYSGDELERTVRTYAGGKTSTTRYLDCE